MLRTIVRRDARHVSGGGFGGFFQSEALPGAVPQKQNTPQKPFYGLYPELLSGSAFTQPRHDNRYTWLYRVRPSILHSPHHFSEYEPYDHPTWVSPPFKHRCPPIQFRFRPAPPAPADTDFLDGSITIAANGCPTNQDGCSAQVYACTSSMSARNRVIRNADADTLIMPQEGALHIRTEMGDVFVEPLELAMIPKGILFQVNLAEGSSGARGYFLENFGAPFVIPDMGPIGISSGLANPRHFFAPQARFEDVVGKHELCAKFQGHLWKGEIAHSPFDVAGWHGSHVPLKYDMRLFMALNTVTFDHPDPSIGVVMSSYGHAPGLANLDFVIFPPRWMTAENTFRPPWFHRNYMSEYMGLIYGKYDAKADSFQPGASSIHNRFTPHGPDAAAVKGGTEMDTSKPVKYENTLAFMWETRLPWHASEWALQNTHDEAYPACWKSVPHRFDPSAEVPAEHPYPNTGYK